jgi:hypothetical protein
LLIAFLLRSYQLDRQALRGDEAATVLYSAMPISELWELARVTDPHPPLYYLTLHPWQQLMGESAWAMRFAGVMASVLAVATFYRLTRHTLPRPGLRLLAAALLALNPLQIWLAQDVRSYPLFTLSGLLSSWALWLALHPNRPLAEIRPSSPTPPYVLRFTFYVPSVQLRTGLRFTPWLLYTLLTVASLYIHYYAVFLIAFQGMFVLFNIQKFWDKKWPWLGSQIAIGLSIIPGLSLAYNFIGQAAGGIEKIAWPDILRLASTALLTGFTIEAHWGAWVSLLLLPIWVSGMVALLRRDRVSGSFWTLFFAFPVLGVIALSIDRPFFKERFFIQAQPAFELLLATGFISLWHIRGTRIYSFILSGFTSNSRTLPGHILRFTFYVLRFTTIILLLTLLAANALALSNYFANPAYAKAPPWHLYHQYVRQKFQPRDVMLTNFPEASISYYSPNGLPFYVVPVERDRSPEFRLEETEKIARAYERIWFLPLLRQGFDEQGDVLNWLDRHADRVDQVFFPTYHLNLYLSPIMIDKLMIEQPAAFAHGIHLRGFQILDEAGKSRLTPAQETGQEFLLVLEPGDEFTLSLYWLAKGPTDQPYTVFAHLIAADGFNRTSQDNQPVWGSYPTTQWRPGEKISDKYTLTLPSGAPPGDHRLRIGWYDSDTLTRVFVLDAAGRPVDDHVILKAIIRVE